MKLSNNKISVIIPTHQGFSDVCDAIDSLLVQSIKPKEIIIIDNASKENIKKLVDKKYNSKKIKTKRLSKNKGVTGGRNAGLKTVDKNSDYVLIFDHDMTADKNMIKNLLSTATSKNNIGIVTPKILYTDDPNVIWSAGTGMNLFTGQVLFRGGKDVGQFENQEEVQVAPAVMLIKNEVLKRVKKFDDIYFATYEDTDFCFSAAKVGYKTFYSPKAIAYHKIPLDESDSSKRLLNRTYWVARNRVIFMKRFGSNFSIFITLFTSIYLAHYSLLSLKHGRFVPIFEYIRGLISGILEK